MVSEQAAPGGEGGAVTGKLVPEIMVLGPKLSLKILVPRTIFFGKNWSALKILVPLPLSCSMPRFSIYNFFLKLVRLENIGPTPVIM